MSSSLQVELDHANRFCIVKNDRGDSIGTYPYVWLRDNCRCEECYYPSSMERILPMANLDIDIVADSAEVEKETLTITWPDGHLSPYPISWLKEFQFQSDMIEDPVDAPVRRYWGKEMKDKIPRFTYEEIVNDEKSLYKWLENLQVYGLAIITDAPLKLGALHEIGEKVAFLKRTHNGTTFELKGEYSESATNMPYSGLELCFHIDMPYLDNPAYIQMLHFLQQPEAKGGENQFADAMKVALDLKENEPELFQILTTVPINFRVVYGINGNVHLKNSLPTIQLNPDGSIKGLRLDNMLRTPLMNIPQKDVYKVYKAIKTLNTMLYDEMVEVKLAPGEIACFDNCRVVHGRSSFTVSKNSTRQVEGGYIEWEHARSRMRVIREQMQNLKHF